MAYRLTALAADICDDAVTTVRMTVIPRDTRRNEEEMSGERRVGRLRERIDVFARDHEDVQRRGRVEVWERDTALVLMEELRRHGAGSDAAEDAVRHTSCATVSGSAERSGMTRVGEVTSSSP